MVKTILILLVITAIYYILYINGYLVFNNKKALTFVGSKRGNKASFSSCTGTLKRVVKFDTDKICKVTLDCQLSKGEMSARLLDSAKREIMHLTSVNQTAAVNVEKGKRYYLVFDFKSASGSYELKWE